MLCTRFVRDSHGCDTFEDNREIFFLSHTLNPKSPSVAHCSRAKIIVRAKNGGWNKDKHCVLVVSGWIRRRKLRWLGQSVFQREAEHSSILNNLFIIHRGLPSKCCITSCCVLASSPSVTGVIMMDGWVIRLANRCAVFCQIIPVCSLFYSRLVSSCTGLFTVFVASPSDNQKRPRGTQSAVEGEPTQSN